MALDTRILDATPDHIHRCAAALRGGELVVMPTETVYGLAAHALREDAVAAVFTAKGRPADDPLIVHIAPPDADTNPIDACIDAGLIAPTLHAALRDTAMRLAAACWPGPLTLVLPRGPAVPDAVTSGLDTVALRMPQHPVAMALLRAAQVPLVAPSANRFGRISPTRALDAHRELDGRVPWILDGGPCDVGIESTVVRVNADGSLTRLRPGRFSAHELNAASGASVHGLHASPSDGPQVSPGLLASHYAPSAPVRILGRASADLDTDGWARIAAALPGSGDVAWITWTPAPELAEHATERLGRHVVTSGLSDDGSPAAAARSLYRVLRELDDRSPVIILVDPVPLDTPLSQAIADRLLRSTGSRPPLDV